MKAAHVPILAGTDAPNPGTSHGVSIHRELELLVRSGLTPQEALACGHFRLRRQRFISTTAAMIAPGKRADLLLVKGDPTQDITATRDIVSVWKLGVEDRPRQLSRGHRKGEAGRGAGTTAAARRTRPRPTMD